jgi:hypothetical protein
VSGDSPKDESMPLVPLTQPGDTVTVYVRPEDIAWFDRRFGGEG